MATLFVLLICGLLPGVFSQCNVQRVQPIFPRIAYEFAIDLTTRIALEKENHFVASTLSPWTLLSVAAMGAAGDTLDELKRVLRLHKNQCFNDRYFELVRTINSDGSNVSLEKSSTIFIDENFSVTDEFIRKVTEAGVSNIKFMPFDNAENVVTTINDYVSQETHDTISDIIVPSDLEDVSLIMIDALFFKGLWQIPFAYEDTEAKPFFNARGAQIGEVNMMVVTGTFNMTSMDLIQADVLELPFGAGRYAMLVMVPYGGVPLTTVMDSLKRITLKTVYASFNNIAETVYAEIPRFKIASDLNNMKELLMDMGLRTAFDSRLAEFSALADQPVFITNFVQKASVEVTEEGATASAATAALFGTRSEPDSVRANKPFFFMIIDKQTLVPIFTGAYSNPSLY